MISVIEKEETCAYVVGEGKRKIQVCGTALTCGPVEDMGGTLQNGRGRGSRKEVGRSKCAE